MEKNTELIKKLKGELEVLKQNIEATYIKSAHNINKIEKEEKEIEKIEKEIDEKEKKNSKTIKEKTVLFIVSTVIIGNLVLLLLGIPPIIKVTMLAMYICALKVIPKVKNMIHNFILKLSPKSKQLEDEINELKKQLSIKREKKQELELIQEELQSKLNQTELNIKEKETELKEAEKKYFNNIFDTNNVTATRNEQHKITVKVRRIQKNKNI